MEDRKHPDTASKVGAIVDNAISELLELGMESRDAAASLMALNAILRIDDNEERRKIADMAASLVWDIDDTE